MSPYVRRWCLRAAAAFRVVPCSGSRGAVDGAVDVAVDVRRNAATTSGHVDDTVAVLPDDGSTRHGYTVAMRFTVARPRRNRETLNRHTKHPRGAEEAGMICMAAACDLLLRVVVLVWCWLSIWLMFWLWCCQPARSCYEGKDRRVCRFCFQILIATVGLPIWRKCGNDCRLRCLSAIARDGQRAGRQRNGDERCTTPLAGRST